MGLVSNVYAGEKFTLHDVRVAPPRKKGKGPRVLHSPCNTHSLTSLNTYQYHNTSLTLLVDYG